ncbi:hypothetical protein [Plastoroseomonas hellenica]|uniref:hypothetical protein n=1 Tax=Plastoroseomonas hellenica TaxID=2687306 RepID=UPI001BA65B82|nr:hypothetical protein [Plastoroseomonas hellenica]MBR0641221.1 type II toxin-antitoxin system RelE/ParE family toxin [Plastoroseomonas hellenica]
MRRYRILLAADVPLDLERIEEHLVRSYSDFGEDETSAAERAAERIAGALAYMETFHVQPHRGTEHPEVLLGIRNVTHERFIYYFRVGDPAGEVRILAVFFGGVEHRRQIADRLRR